eukprot:6998894-Prymnesium_polylepis.1
MNDASTPLPFTFIKMGDRDGVVPFDGSVLSTIAARCPNLEMLDLQGPADCLPAGLPPPDIGEGLLDLAQKCCLLDVSLLNVRTTTPKMHFFFKMIADSVEHLQVSFALIENGSMDDVCSNRPPGADPTFSQAHLVQFMGEMLADAGRIKDLHLDQLDCRETV